jgi:hypothetical protein
MNLELIIDNWLAEHYPSYFVWSIPDPAYPHWAVRAYIIHTENEALVAAIINYKIVPTTDYKTLSKPLQVSDPKFFDYFEAFMDKVSKRHK